MDVSPTLLYIFLAVIQIYILFTVGILCAVKKIFSPRSVKSISELLINYFLPVYATLELARMATWPNVEIMWLLIISVFVAITGGFYIAKLIHWLFKLDERISRSYSYLMSFPSLGTLPLVLGKALCYPGGMLEGDPNCQHILGFMMMNFLVFQIMLFGMGFVLMPKDANFSNILTEKMGYLWHILIPRVIDKNYTINYFFRKFIKDQKKAGELFELFNKKYKLTMQDDEKIQYKYLEDENVKLDFELKTTPKKSGSIKRKSTKRIPIIDFPEAHQDNQNLNDSYFNNSCHSINEVNNAENKETNNIEASDKNHTDYLLNTESHFLKDNNDKQLKNEKIVLEIVENEEEEEYFDEDGNNVNEEENEEEKNEGLEKKEGIVIDVPFGDHEIPEDFNFSKDWNYVIGEPERRISRKMTLKEQKSVQRMISLYRKTSFRLFENDIELYYNQMFSFIETFLEETKRNEFEEFKVNTQKSIFSVPPKFPVVRYIQISRDMVKEIENEWIKFEKSAKQINSDFKLATHEIPISFSVILNKMHSPPIIGCFLGLIIGMSGMREILFSPNHYISNIVEGIYIFSRPTVPFLYTVLGISMLSIRGMNMLNTPINKWYVIITFIMRFIILPGIGYIYVYLWSTYYGGIIATSKVFRISMFIPFCLPATATVAVIVNVVKYFGEETGLILFAHNTTIVITLTVLYLIYYVLLG